MRPYLRVLTQRGGSMPVSRLANKPMNSVRQYRVSDTFPTPPFAICRRT
jgi:hypothetical protein